MYINNLVQLINEPTRITDTTAREIDLILTTCPGIVKASGVLPEIDSDHKCVYMDIKCNIPRNNLHKRTIYCYDKLDCQKFKDTLLSINWNEIISEESIDVAANLFTDRLFSSANDCMPSKTVTFKENDAPWMSDEIRKLIEKKTKNSYIC